MAVRSSQGVSIQGKQFDLQKIFCNDFAFSIPPYQRPYAWTQEQAEELLDDVLTAMGDGPEPVEELIPYFLGSIVLIKVDGSPESQVVDGQQRLTTLTMLLAALRNTIEGPDSKELTEFLYEQGSQIKGTQDRFRLRLRPRDEQFFRDFIQAVDGLSRLADLDPATLESDSQRAIRENALFFKRNLGELDNADRLRLARYLVTRCYMVVVWSSDKDSAYRVFSVLNNRGLDLTHADLLKAEIIGAMPAAKELQYTEKWEEAEVGLGREGFAELFTYIRMIYCKEKARRSILADFRDHVTSKTNAVDLVDRVILPYGEALEDILASAFEASSNADKVNLSLRWLNMIDNSDWIPPAILFLAKNRPSSDKIAEFFAELDRLASGLMILRSNINERIERYAAVLAEIEAGKDFKAAGSSMQLRKEEKENILRILDGDLYLGIKTRLYVLLRLDNSLSGGGAQYQHGIITIEHVLPQSPAMGSKWVQWFPSESDRTSRVHKMGNLALLTRRKNSSAQNYDFDQKKTKYFSVGGISPFVLTTQVLGEPTWGPEVIDRRQKDLVAKLAKLWRLD